MSLELLKLIEQADINELTPNMCVKIINDIKEGNMEVVTLVDGLRTPLTDSDKDKRRTGVEILSLVLSQLPINILNTTEITFLTEYYCGCLLDHHSMIPAILKGVLALVMMEEFPTSAIQKLFTMFNLHFICQSQEREDRLTFYKILFRLINLKHDDLLCLGPDFVFGVLSAVNGEKDAVNLLYMFKNLPKFFNLFPLGHLADDAFEVVSCYFPVDYEGTANVTREELAENLNNCLIANDEFVEGTINLAIDKVTSALKVAKTDSLILLKLSFKKFKIEKILPFVRNIISTLWQELRIGNLDDDVQLEINDTIAVLIKSCGVEEEIDIAAFKNILNDMYKCVYGFLSDLSFTTFSPALTFLLVASKVSSSSCEFITNKLLPNLATIVPVTTSDALAQMKAYNRIIKVCHLYSVNPSELEDSRLIWGEILQLYIAYIDTCDVLIKVQIIRFFSYIVISSLDRDNRHKAYLLFYRSFSNGNQKVRKKSLRGLRYAATGFPVEVESFLISRIVDEPGNCTDTVEKHLTLLCTLCVIPNFVPHLCHYIKSYMVQDNFIYVPCVLRSLKDHIVRIQNDKSRCNKYAFSDIKTHCFLINYLCDTWRNILFEDQRKHHSIDTDLSIILISLISSLGKEYQTEILNSQLTQYLNILKDPIPSIIIIEGIVGGLSADTLETLDVCSLLRDVISTTVCVTTLLEFHAGGRIVASILNKIQTVITMQEILRSIQDIILPILESEEEIIQNRERAVLLFAYAIKGLVLRQHDDVIDYLNKYLDYVSDINIGKFASEGFKIMTVHDDWFLNNACHVDIRPTYKRMLFNRTVSKLLDRATESSDSTIKSNCVRAVAYQLLSVDYTDVREVVIKALPPFVEMLDADVPSDIILPILKTFREFLKNGDDIFKNYISTLISIFLRMARDSSFMEVRICSLECLYYYAKYETYMILPYKSQVIAELTACLSDRKRFVRREAASTRCFWHTVGV